MAEENIGKLRLLCLDVDGVLTDGRILIDDHGVETKQFHVRDGAGIRMWMSLGNEVAIITGRRSMAVGHRARELGIHHVHQGCRDKVQVFKQVLHELGLNAEQAAMMGDDVPDLSVMDASGYAIAVADAPRIVREAADLVTVRPGGLGAVREAIEHVLEKRGQWEDAIAYFG